MSLLRETMGLEVCVQRRRGRLALEGMGFGESEAVRDRLVMSQACAVVLALSVVIWFNATSTGDLFLFAFSPPLAFPFLPERSVLPCVVGCVERTFPTGPVQ